jgi:alpha-tubulin suppressor-like RCC1 family protein
LTNYKFNKSIYNDEYFWGRIFYRDFGVEDDVEHWKNLYKDYKNSMHILAFGSNIDGQLGLGDHRDRNSPIQISNLKAKYFSTGDTHTIVIDIENNVWIFESDLYGQLGLVIIKTEISQHKYKR